MRTPIPHLVILALPVLLAACAASPPAGPPPARVAQSGARCPSPVAVGAGDTVYSVARRCGVSVRELIEANHLQAPYSLADGMRLVMPGGGGEHIVRSGDTLLALARHYHVEFQAFAAANGKTPPYTLHTGEKLRIPGAHAGADGAGSQLVVASPNSGSGRAAAWVPPPPPPRETAFLPRSSASVPVPPSPPSGSAQAPAQPQSPPLQPPIAVPAPATASGRGFLWPVKGDVLVEFGPQAAKGQNNDGINIAAVKGAPVRAAENGVVAYVGNELKGFGNLVLLKHADGWMTAYAHTDQVNVKRGDTVRRGQVIATVGATGSVAAPQLHFEIRRGTEAVNPTPLLSDGPV